MKAKFACADFTFPLLSHPHALDLISNLAKEQTRYGGGLNYYVYGQNFKMTAYYERIVPKVMPTTAQIKDLNRFVVQWQGSF